MSMSEPLIVGVSGLRGIVGESLSFDVAMRYAAAFGTWLKRDGEGETVVVGRDGRHGGLALQQAVMAGLMGVGCDVVDVGVVPTPTVGVVANEYGAVGVVVTASHNGQAWNGIKCLCRDAQGSDAIDAFVVSAPVKGRAEEIIGGFEGNEIDWVRGELVGEYEQYEGGCKLHLQLVGEAVFLDLMDKAGREKMSGFRVVLDSLNASGSRVGGLLLHEAVGQVIQLGGGALVDESFGIFEHEPEPTAENLAGEGGLCDVVVGARADVGFAQDPDADRLAIVDETGRYIGEEYTLVLAAEALLQLREADGGDEEMEAGRGVIVVNLSTSRMIDDVAAKFGVEVVRTPVGEANVVQKMRELGREGFDVVVGGEGNGGVIWPGTGLVRDSLAGMGLVLGLMASTGKTVSELAGEVPGYAIMKRKVGIDSKEAAEPLVEAVAEHFREMGRVLEGAKIEIDRQDGVRVDLVEQKAWLHVRASNTESIVRLIAEAQTQEDAEALLEMVEELIREKA